MSGETKATALERLRSTMESFHGLISGDAFDALHQAVRDVEEEDPTWALFKATDKEIVDVLTRSGVDVHEADARFKRFLTKARAAVKPAPDPLDAPAFRAIDERTRVTAANIRGVK